jgi:hypothetical protein
MRISGFASNVIPATGSYTQNMTFLSQSRSLKNYLESTEEGFETQKQIGEGESAKRTDCDDS